MEDGSDGVEEAVDGANNEKNVEDAGLPWGGEDSEEEEAEGYF